ncbi:MAG: helicase HerA-like domain-containing protein [Polyangiaceae bacterium]
MTERDARLDVFLSPVKRDIFHSVEHRGQIWREDPFDVTTVHEHARTQFQRVLTQVTTPPGLDAGRVLLMRGEAGSGKTHLVRAFRNHVHLNGLGFVGYMQMTTSITSYGRYLVSNLIDSLDQTYYEALGTSSGLLRLSNAVAARCPDQQAIRALSERPDLDASAVVDLVETAADRIISNPRYSALDLDLVRALLFLQREDPALKKRVVKFLRCETLSERDQRMLGGLSPKVGEEDAQRLVEEIGRLMWACDSRALVLCVDQFEDAYQAQDAEALFRRTLSSLCAVADQVPSSVVVIACLSDYYDVLRARLTCSTLDRVETDPAPVDLRGERSLEEVEQILRQRLSCLFDASDPPSTDVTDNLYPFPRDFVQQLSGLRIRDVLDLCHKFRDACIEAGKIVEWTDLPLPRPAEASRTDEQQTRATKQKIEHDWNDFLAEYKEERGEDESSVAELFGWALQTCADELDSQYRFEVRVDGPVIEVKILTPTGNGGPVQKEELLIVLCNKAPQGGGLKAQMESAQARAGGRRLVLLRCGEFPKKSGTQVHTTLVDILKSGGRKAVLQESDLRTIEAFRRFRSTHEQREQFTSWLRESNRLSRLLPLIHTLDLDNLGRSEEKAPSPQASPSPTPKKAVPGSPGKRQPPKRWSAPPMDIPDEELRGDPVTVTVGTTGELIAQELTFDAEVLTTHAAFLGSTGSGKTTLALNIVEQLLLSGVPAILVDRKGDLAGYAREGLFQEPHPDPELEARRVALRDKLEIAVFTPGNPEGRQLALSLIPRGLAKLKDLERDQAAGYAAEALGDMLGYRHTRKDKGLRTILVQAFQLFAAHDASDKLDIETLITFIANEDPALVSALGRLDTRLFKDLVHDLEVLKLSSATLLSGAGEELDAELLLGLGAHARAGRTRLSIVSTKFLGDNARILFWVSQLLLSLSRWVTRSPTRRLQAIALFDEADMYLPAQSQPATKAPMENLLRRARSGGLGLMLATQSPGDLDYKCRDNLRSWFVGRVTQQVAIDKMKPLLSDARIDVGARIPGQGVGEFHLLQDGSVKAFKARFPLLRTEQLPDSEVVQLAAQGLSARRRGS